MNILLCPPKIIFQHSREEWQSLQSVAPVLIATCASQIDNILDHMGAGFLSFFMKTLMIIPSWKWIFTTTPRTIKQRVSFTSPKSMF